MEWVAGYERGWREEDLGAVERLFTADARTARHRTRSPRSATTAIRAFWLDDAGQTFTMSAWPVAVEGDQAAVRVDVSYGSPVRQEYRDLWLLRFAADGRVADFEEWAYWPGKPYSAEAEDSSGDEIRPRNPLANNRSRYIVDVSATRPSTRAW